MEYLIRGDLCKKKHSVRERRPDIKNHIDNRIIFLVSSGQHLPKKKQMGRAKNPSPRSNNNSKKTKTANKHG